jgi:hypothetical protein
MRAVASASVGLACSAMSINWGRSGSSNCAHQLASSSVLPS